MAEHIRMNYPAVEDMKNQCKAVQDRLLQTANKANTWAQTMQNGALQGTQGDLFVQALGILNKQVTKLANKFGEEVKDIGDAINDMRQSDTAAGKNF
jgi:uncharacterized protein YukE